MSASRASISIVTPHPTFRAGLDGGPNAFRERFGSLSDEEWRDLLIRAIKQRIIDDIEFPGYPDAELQSSIHGHSAEFSLEEAYTFYAFTRSRPFLVDKMGSDSNFLDFGSGWGRIARMFLRDFDLHRMFGFEPYIGYCAVARVLNPYMCFLNGDYLPDGTLPPNRFDLVVGWSVFSHLSEYSATRWLEEMARAMRPDGHCVFTTWGERFLNRLIEEEAAMEAGEPPHWYSKQCLDAAGNIREKRKQFLDGKFVWFTGHNSDLYGEAFIHPDAIRRLLRARNLPLELVEFDAETLVQDVFILRRR